jgi:rRNA maturation endonuclease Nob1
MKTCPNCKAELEDNFEICWKCQYSLVDDKVLVDSDYKLVCPACRTIVDETMQFCPVCRFDLSKYQMVKKKAGDKVVECASCKVPIFLLGKYEFQEGFDWGIFTNRESFNLYVCPKCRKLEFYLPD